MPDSPNPGKTFTQKTFTTTQVVAGALITPSVGLYQPVYPMTEVEFVKLRQSNPVLSATAGAVISFGLAYALPLLVNYLLADPSSRDPVKRADVWVASISVGFGMILLFLSFGFSAERRKVLKRMKKHFEENPGQHEIRVGK